MRTSVKNSSLILLGVFIALLLIELLLRAGGFFYLANQGNISQTTTEDIVILTLGESTTAGSNNWPSILEKKLQTKFPTKNITVINRGVPAITSAYIVNELEDNLEKYDPDIAVTMLGINDRSNSFIYDTKADRFKEPIYTRLRLYSLWEWLDTRKEEFGSDKSMYPLSYDDATCNQNVTDVSLTSIDNTRIIECTNGSRTNTRSLLKNIKENPCDYQTYPYAMNCFLDNNLTKEGKQVYELASEIFPRNAEIHRFYGDYLIRNQKYNLAEKTYLKGVTIKPDWTHLKKSLIELYKRTEQKEKLDRFLTENELSYTQSSYTKEEVTRYHYRLIAKELQKRNITHIAMQYPTLELTRLKNYLDDFNEVIYVSNKENFESALAKHPYKDLFTDTFGKSFGHKTRLGNEILVQKLIPIVSDVLQNQTEITS